jgi:putative membrane protein insertion efficiency factor
LKLITVPRSNASTSFKRLALLGVNAYQVVLRPLLAGSGSCRYVPTCSEYARESIETYGAVRGGWMALKRVARCHPFGSHGLDQVPQPPRRQPLS